MYDVRPDHLECSTHPESHCENEVSNPEYSSDKRRKEFSQGQQRAPKKGLLCRLAFCNRYAATGLSFACSLKKSFDLLPPLSYNCCPSLPLVCAGSHDQHQGPEGSQLTSSCTKRIGHVISSHFVQVVPCTRSCAGNSRASSASRVSSALILRRVKRALAGLEESVRRFVAYFHICQAGPCKGAGLADNRLRGVIRRQQPTRFYMQDVRKLNAQTAGVLSRQYHRFPKDNEQRINDSDETLKGAGNLGTLHHLLQTTASRRKPDCGHRSLTSSLSLTLAKVSRPQSVNKGHRLKCTVPYNAIPNNTDKLRQPQESSQWSARYKVSPVLGCWTSSEHVNRLAQPIEHVRAGRERHVSTEIPALLGGNPARQSSSSVVSIAGCLRTAHSHGAKRKQLLPSVGHTDGLDVPFLLPRLTKRNASEIKIALVFTTDGVSDMSFKGDRTLPSDALRSVSEAVSKSLAKYGKSHQRDTAPHSGPRWCSGLTTRLPAGRTWFDSSAIAAPGFPTSCRAIPLVGWVVFSGISRFPQPSHHGAAPYVPRFNLFGSQDLDVKSRPNLSAPGKYAETQKNALQTCCALLQFRTRVRPPGELFFSAERRVFVSPISGVRACGRRVLSQLRWELCSTHNNPIAPTRRVGTTKYEQRRMKIKIAVDVSPAKSQPHKIGSKLGWTPLSTLEIIVYAHWLLTLLLPAYNWLAVKRGVSKELSSNHNSRRKEQASCGDGAFKGDGGLVRETGSPVEETSRTSLWEGEGVVNEELGGGIRGRVGAMSLIRGLRPRRACKHAGNPLPLFYLLSPDARVSVPSRSGSEILAVCLECLVSPGPCCQLGRFRTETAHWLRQRNKCCIDISTAHIIKCWATVLSLLASNQGDPGSIPGRVTPDFRMWESCRTMPLVGGFSRGSPVSPALSFRRCSILTSITLIASQDLDVKSRPNLFTQ
ncbi:hypothetical protein PR048_032716 [Dryococelus australis]|uniref:Uncharacterized protein n=1 Tax=Dryococelus australis TaxID=614101 RepID=A0ABQ9G301_9NEOP|nr:hypothetical protein PR048_032716 [Dryococelus australis]